MTYTIFIVDDDPSVRKAQARVLAAEGWKVETFGSAEAFLVRPKDAVLGCLVLDVTMPGLDGFDLQQRLAADGRALPIVFVTGHGDIPMSVRAMRAGATDFLTKPVPAQVLIEAIRRAIEEGETQRHARAATDAIRERLATLTPREREVLDALAAGKLNKQIAADLGVVEQTVKFHRARIMERLHAKTVAELMHIAARAGVGADTTGPLSERPVTGNSRQS